MRRRFRKSRQIMAGLSAAVLLMTSLPQDVAYVYAAEQVEEQQPQAEETTHTRTESEPDKTGYLSAENPSTEAGTVDGMENAESDETEEKSDQGETKETGEKSDPEETKDTEEKPDQEESKEETDVPDGDGEETDLEGETEKPEESVETEESAAFEEEEQETESAEKADSQEKVVKAKLSGGYQFGDAPSKRGGVSTFSVDSETAIDTAELEEYLYQQIKARNTVIDIKKYGFSDSEADVNKIGDIVTGVLNEHPDLYFVGKSYSMSSSGGTITTVKLTYSASYDDKAFQKATKEALAVVKPGMSDLEKAIVLHDYLAVNCEYDKENYDQEAAGTGKIPDVSYTAYGTLVERMSVCEGYALAYKYLLQESGIECLMVNSSAMNHAWNLIKLDGEYYQVDVTSDDPTWDRVGRARHEYMFRSDDAFQNKCGRKYYGWSVTKGSEVVDYKAEDTSYDEAFWLDCDSPLVLVGEDCYYVTYDDTVNTGVIKKNKLSNTTGGGMAVCDIGTWGVWNGSGYWQGTFSGLFYVNDRLYYNDASSICSFAFDDAGEVTGKKEEFSPDTTDGYIYGSAFCQGEVRYSLHKDPNEEGKEEVLTADIKIESGEPSETPGENGIASGSYGNITWKIDADGKLTVEGNGEFAGSSGSDRAPWYANRESIISAEVQVTDLINASAMFYGCKNLASVDLSGFDTSKVTNMSNMFYECESLSNLDLKNFKTENVTDMSGMFSYCSNLANLDVSGFSTENVTSMLIMFQSCEKLASLDLGNFKTENVTNMSFMFNLCSNLQELDLRSFDTSKVTSMEGMFSNCNSLTKIDVSSFETGNVTNMGVMFESCNNLVDVDLAKFNTGNVTSMRSMFYNCANLERLDLSSFDMSKVEDGTYLLYGCSKLTTVDTPYNLNGAVPLPTVETEDIWYMPDGTAITELPQNLSHSIKISKNSVPEASALHIAVQKTKTVYACGDVLNLDDLTVIYYDSDGTVETVTDYTTNVDEIDMSVPGTKTLTVSYNGLTATVNLTVTASAITDPDQETCTVTFNLQDHGTVLAEYSTYTEIKKGSTIRRPASPEAAGYEFTGWYKEVGCQTLWDFEKDTVEGNITLYAGWKSSEKVEEESNEKPVINSVQFPGKKSEYSAVYTGEQIRPVMVVTYQYTDAGGKPKSEKLKLNVDYTVRYSNNVNAGEKTAQVTVRGIGGYTGVVTSEFTITPKNIKSVTLSAVGDIVFGGEPSVRVTDGTKELVEGRDYNVALSTKGSADTDTQSKLTVVGIGNYTGTSAKSVKFNILRRDTDILSIASENIQVEFKNPAKKYTYNGKAQKPAVVVTDTKTGKKISSSMYKVIYSNNINAGKKMAKAWVVGVSKNGKGYYGISEPLYFDIEQKDFKKVSASLSGTIPKIGSIENIRKSIDEALIVKDAKHVLSENEYTIDYGDIKAVDDIKIGKKYPVTLTARPDGNYIKDSQKIVNIKFGQLNLASKTANKSVIIINASQNEIEFRYNGILLEKDKDYTATVTKVKNKDTYTVKIKAVKDSAYKGSITFKNLQADQDTEGGDSVIPEIPNAKPAVSNNKDAQNYRWGSNYNWNWADNVKSYLYENPSGGLTRVEYISGKIMAEDYDDSFCLLASREIPMELSIWGGFYAGDQYNFVFFGQNNPSQDDNAEVVRVVKYSKDWQRLGKASLCGANTTEPFEAGSLRCAGYGDYLYIRTCHEMYKSSDGYNHQANMTFVVRQSDMTITDSFYQVLNYNYGYVSHSFNQFVLVDQDQNLVTLDHGDAYPRGIVLMRPVNAKAGGDKFSGRFEKSNLVEFSGGIGNNVTGASIGGFAETKNGYVTAFNYDGTGSGGSRAVYLGFTSKSGLDTKVASVTGYDGMLAPVLAPAGLDGGYLMWTDAKGKFYYTRYADGGTTGTVNTGDACLSDCQPILYNGACVWYVTQKSVPTFYKLDVSSSEISKIVAK